MKPWHRRPAVTTPTAPPAAALSGIDATDVAPAPQRVVRTRRPSLLARIGGTLLTLVMALALIVFVSMTVLRISGGELLAIRTGSMSPVMEPGDLLISRDVDARTVRRGDVITFRVPSADNTLVTHRVTKVDTEGNTFSTKGDANDTVDPFTTKAKDVLGIRWFSIPKVGRLMVFLSSGLGTALLIGVPAAIYLGQTLSDRRSLHRARATAAAAATSTTAAGPAAAEAPSAPAAPASDPSPATPTTPTAPTTPTTPTTQTAQTASTTQTAPPPCTLPPPTPAMPTPAVPLAVPTPAMPPAPVAPFPIAVPTAQLPASVAGQVAGDWVLVVPIGPAMPFPSPVPATPPKEHQP